MNDDTVKCCKKCRNAFGCLGHSTMTGKNDCPCHSAADAVTQGEAVDVIDLTRAIEVVKGIKN